jgi:hypothetical protein
MASRRLPRQRLVHRCFPSKDHRPFLGKVKIVTVSSSDYAERGLFSVSPWCLEYPGSTLVTLSPPPTPKVITSAVINPDKRRIQGEGGLG